MTKLKRVLVPVLALLLGLVIGAYLFSQTQPRSLLALRDCQGTCLNANEIVGLLASVGINRLPGFIPKVVKETDKTIAIEHPAPTARIHYLILPKRDLKNFSELTADDREYIVDLYAVTAELIREQKLTDYQVISNGPARQGATYLHFHLVSR